MFSHRYALIIGVPWREFQSEAARKQSSMPEESNNRNQHRQRHNFSCEVEVDVQLGVEGCNCYRRNSVGV